MCRILKANASAFGQKLIFYIIFQEEKDESSKFEISVSDDFSGRWAFKSKTRGYFLGSNADALVCTAKVPNDSELWFVHLAVRPQVNLHSIGRKRFAHLSDVQVRGRPQRTSAIFSLFLTPTPLMSATVCISRTPP